jgi:hypothetical protein
MPVGGRLVSGKCNVLYDLVVHPLAFASACDCAGCGLHIGCQVRLRVRLFRGEAVLRLPIGCRVSRGKADCDRQIECSVPRSLAL